MVSKITKPSDFNHRYGNSGFYKVYRFSKIYGYRRALVKALGRLRVGKFTRFIINPFKTFRRNKIISVIGCGQFTYTTSSFFLYEKLGNCFDACFDIDAVVARTYSQAFDADVVSSVKEIVNRRDTKLVYIASNHASHTDYAIQCLEIGLDVYVEKPISVNQEEFLKLKAAYSKSHSQMYVGYNRPFSSAMMELKRKIGTGPITLCCTVIGHKLGSEHWYRDPNEGTRVCGNLGHWIDLAINLLSSIEDKIINSIDIVITYANETDFDDNITVTLVTDTGDLIVLTITAREEPFEGIYESIVFQQEGLFVTVDDFQSATFQSGHKKVRRKYSPKDVGHKKAILQPFDKEKRDINEVFLSTEVMLFIADMVKRRETSSRFYKTSRRVDRPDTHNS